MALLLDLQVAGVSELKRGFTRFADNVRDLRPAWPGVVATLQSAAGQQFASEGGYGGAHWQPLSPGYAAWKAKHFPGRRLLVLTGRLRMSLTGETEDSVIEMHPLELVWGTSVPYAVKHQRGDAASRLPARPPIRIAEPEKQEIMRIVQRYLVQRAKAEGLL